MTRGEVFSGDEHSVSKSISDDASRSERLEDDAWLLDDIERLNLKRRPTVDATKLSR